MCEVMYFSTTYSNMETSIAQKSQERNEINVGITKLSVYLLTKLPAPGLQSV
jgi:hypothetical protein